MYFLRYHVVYYKCPTFQPPIQPFLALILFFVEQLHNDCEQVGLSYTPI